MITEVSNLEDLKDQLSKTELPNVIVDCFAPWCNPCKILFNFLNELNDNHDDLLIIKVDIDTAIDIKEEYDIMSVPTLLYFKDKELIDKTTGLVMTEQIESKFY